MNHLTQYYRNLSEQLQEQVNKLQAMLDEAVIHSAREKVNLNKGKNFQNLNKALDAGNARRDFFRAIQDLSKTTEDQKLKDIVTRVMSDVSRATHTTPGIEAALNVDTMKTGLRRPSRKTAGVEGFADDSPEVGYTTADELRTLLTALKGTSRGRDYFELKKLRSK